MSDLRKKERFLKLYLHNFENVVIAMKQQHRVILSNDSHVKHNYFDYSLYIIIHLIDIRQNKSQSTIRLANHLYNLHIMYSVHILLFYAFAINFVFFVL